MQVPQTDTVCQIPEIENRENKTASFFLFNQMYTSRNREKKSNIWTGPILKNLIMVQEVIQKVIDTLEIENEKEI